MRIPVYIFASIAVALGGFLNGFDTGSIGALTAMKQFTDTVGELSPTLLGFTVSLIMLTGAVPSVWAGYLADRYGRLRVLVLGAMLFVIGAILQGSAKSLSQFLVGRALGGLGEGVYLSTMCVYICEIVPLKHRGTLAGLPQFMATAGVCAGYFTCYGTVHMQSSMAWRLPYVLQSLIGGVFIGSCFILPDSPRWLLLQGRQLEALRALERLDFIETEEQQAMLGQMEQRSSLSACQSFLLLFRRGYRARTILALFILGMIQLSGIDGVLYVSLIM
jgi:MFS family permease